MIFSSVRDFFRQSRWIGIVRRVIAMRGVRCVGGALAAMVAAATLADRLLPPAERAALLAGAREAVAGRASHPAFLFWAAVAAAVFVAALLRGDFWKRTLLLLGLGAFLMEAGALAPNLFSGHADFSGYAEMAHSLIQRRGLEVDYVSWYFRAYERLPRPEDHWPPFYSFLIVPFYLALGRCALAVRLPGALAACLLLPAAIHAISARLSRSSAVGFAAGLHALLYPAFVCFTLSAPFDIASAWITTLAVALALKGFDHPHAFLLMGLVGGLAAYAKGNAILLLPLFTGLYVFVRLFWPAPVAAAPAAQWLRSRWLPLGLAAILALAFVYRFSVGLAFLPAAVWLSLCGVLYRRWHGTFIRCPIDRDFLAGLAIWIAVVTPWAVRNLRFFGDPFYSTQSHVPAYIGRKGWEEGTYPLYWGRPPRIAERFADRATYWNMTRRFARQYFWWIFMDTAESQEEVLVPPYHNAPPPEVPLWTAARHFLRDSVRGGDGGPWYVWWAGLTALAGIVFVFVFSAARVVVSGIGFVQRLVQRSPTPANGEVAPSPPFGDENASTTPSRVNDLAPEHVLPSASAGLPGWSDPRWLWLPAVGGALAAFLILFWEPIHRLESPSIALMLAGAWAFFGVAARGVAGILMRGLPRRWRSPHALSAFAAVPVLTVAATVAPTQAALWPQRLENFGKVSTQYQNWIKTGLWMAEHLKDSVTMTRNPWQLHFYSQQFAVQIPLAPVEDLLSVMRRYGVTHIIPDYRRPALVALMRRHARAFPVVFRAGSVSLHEVRYDALPPALRDIPPIPMPEHRAP